MRTTRLPGEAPLTPRSRQATLDRWRKELRLLAYGAVTLAGGSCRGVWLANKIGISPNGLRQLIDGDGILYVDMRMIVDRHGKPRERMIIRMVMPPADQEAQGITGGEHVRQIRHDRGQRRPGSEGEVRSGEPMPSEVPPASRREEHPRGIAASHPQPERHQDVQGADGQGAARRCPGRDAAGEVHASRPVQDQRQQDRPHKGPRGT